MSTTWILDKQQLETNFTLDELLFFSKKHNSKIIVKDFCTILNGKIINLTKKTKKNLFN